MVLILMYYIIIDLVISEIENSKKGNRKGCFVDKTKWLIHVVTRAVARHYCALCRCAKSVFGAPPTQEVKSKELSLSVCMAASVSHWLS